MLLGATGLQVCTAVMHRGFGIIKAMNRGLEQWMKQKGFESINQIVGQATPRIRHWGDLNLNYKVIAQINESTCIHCGICYASCEDGCYQAIDWQKTVARAVRRKIWRTAQLKGEAAPNLRLDESGGTIDVFTVNTDQPASAATCAPWPARLKVASRWKKCRPANRP